MTAILHLHYYIIHRIIVSYKRDMICEIINDKDFPRTTSATAKTMLKIDQALVLSVNMSSFAKTGI